MMESQTAVQQKFLLCLGLVLALGSLYFIKIAWDWYRQYGYDDLLVGMTGLLGVVLLGAGLSLLLRAVQTPVEGTKRFDELEAADFPNHDPNLVTQWLTTARSSKRTASGFPRWLIIVAVLLSTLGGLIFKAIGLVIWLFYLRFYLKNIRPVHMAAARLQRAAGIDRVALVQALNRPVASRKQSW